MSTLDRSWLLLQLTDSAFPAGAFAHSGGLEAAWQLGNVNDSAALVEFLRTAQQQAAVTSAPIVAAVCSDVGRAESLDGFCDALWTNSVANQASRSQGKALLAAATRVFKSALLGEIERSIRRSESPCHLAVAFGAVHAVMQVDPRTAVDHFLFMSLRGLVSAAVRLGIVGPLEGQSIQYELSKESPQWVAACMAVEEIEEVTPISPVLDFYQSLQQQLYSRLFVS